MLKENTNNVTDMMEILNAVDDHCKILLKLLVEYYNKINKKNKNLQIVCNGQTVDLDSPAAALLLQSISAMISNATSIGTNSTQVREEILRYSS